MMQTLILTLYYVEYILSRPIVTPNSNGNPLLMYYLEVLFDEKITLNKCADFDNSLALKMLFYIIVPALHMDQSFAALIAKKLIFGV